MTELEKKALEAAQTETVARAMYEHEPHKRQEPWEELIGGPDAYWMGKAETAIEAYKAEAGLVERKLQHMSRRQMSANVVNETVMHERDEARRELTDLQADIARHIEAVSKEAAAADEATISHNIMGKKYHAALGEAEELGKQIAALREALWGCVNGPVSGRVLDLSRAALTATEEAAALYQRVDDEHVVVPRLITDVQREAAQDASGALIWETWYDDLYEAAVAAAPVAKPQAGEGTE